MITELLSHDTFSSFAVFLAILCAAMAIISGAYHHAIAACFFGMTVANLPTAFAVLLDLEETGKPESAVAAAPSPLTGVFDGFLGFIGTGLIYVLCVALAAALVLCVIKGVSLYRNFEFRVQILQFAFRLLHWKFGIKDPYAHLTVYLHKPEMPYEPLSFPEIEEIPAASDKS